MNDQPREEKAPEGADQPTVEQPTAVQPTAEAAAASTPEPASAGGQATPADQTSPAPETAGPTAQGDAPQTAVHGQQPPPTPQLSQPGPGQAYGAWGPPPPAQRQ